MKNSDAWYLIGKTLFILITFPLWIAFCLINCMLKYGGGKI